MTESTQKVVRTGRLLCLILLAGLALRVFYLVGYSSLPEWSQLTVDNWYHHNWARALVFGDHLEHTTYFRAPFYTWCLAGLYWVAGESLWVGRLFGVVVGLVSIVFTYLIGRRLGGLSIGLIAAALHAVYPVAVYFEGELLLDPVFTLLLEISVYQFLGWLEQPRARTLAWSGIWLGLAAITRPTALVLLPIFLGVMLSRPLRQRVEAGIWRQVGLLIGATALVIAPLTVRNLVVAHDPVLISSQGGINFFIGNNEAADGVSAVMPEPYGFNWQIRQITYTAEQAEGRKLTPGQVSSYWAGQAWGWITDNPGRAMGLFFSKLYRQFSNDEISNNRSLSSVWANYPLLRHIPLGFAVLFALAVVGAVWEWRRSVATQALILVIVAYALAVSLFFFNSRFRLPLLPYYFVLAAVGLRGLIALAGGERRRLWGPISVATAASLFSLLPLAPLTGKASPQSDITAGIYHYSHDEFERAVLSFRRAARVDPGYPEVNTNLGASYCRLGLVDSARFYFEREIELHPDRYKSWQNLASLDLVMGRIPEAVSGALRTVALAPYDAAAQMTLLRAAAADSAYSTELLADLCMKAAAATDDNLSVLYEASAALIARGAIPDALRTLDKAVEARPPAIETTDAMFSSLFDYSGAAFRKTQAKVFNLLGYVRGLEGDWSGASRACEESLQRDSTQVQAWLNLSTSLKAEGRLLEADSVALEAERRFPSTTTEPSSRTELRQ